jgi:hypothetical protein
MLSLLFVMRGSKNFTSSLAVRMLPSVPIDHCVRNEANETFSSGNVPALRQTHSTGWSHTIFRYSMLEKIRAYPYSGLPALSTLILSK